jgi:hypothetical protein
LRGTGIAFWHSVRGHELLACRRLGLVVDEDFERGIGPQRRIERRSSSRPPRWAFAAAGSVGLIVRAAQGPQASAADTHFVTPRVYEAQIVWHF